MALLKGFRDAPAGGWRYVQPETGVRFESDTFDDLISKILPHRKYKGIPFDNLRLDVQRQICASQTNGECEAEPGEDYRPINDLTASMTTGKALSFGRSIVSALAEVAAGRAPLCPVEESQARATVCRGCPFNKDAALCSCTAVYKAVEASIPKDRRQPGISVCMACGCSLQAKVNLPLKVVNDGNHPEMVFPDWCWQRPGAPLSSTTTSDTKA